MGRPRRYRDPPKAHVGCWMVQCVLGLLIVPAAHAALQLSTDGRTVAFGIMQLEEERTLSQAGAFQNRITVSSSNGQPWYLKISLLHPLAFGAHEIPLEHFRWQMSSSTGVGSIPHRNRFRAFRFMPDLVYISGAGEENGTPVTLEFQYQLEIPDSQVAGVYYTTIRFTLTEVL